MKLFSVLALTLIALVSSGCGDVKDLVGMGDGDKKEETRASVKPGDATAERMFTSAERGITASSTDSEIRGFCAGVADDSTHRDACFHCINEGGAVWEQHQVGIAIFQQNVGEGHCECVNQEIFSASSFGRFYTEMYRASPASERGCVNVHHACATMTKEQFNGMDIVRDGKDAVTNNLPIGNLLTPDPWSYDSVCPHAHCTELLVDTSYQASERCGYYKSPACRRHFELNETQANDVSTRCRATTSTWNFSATRTQLGVAVGGTTGAALTCDDDNKVIKDGVCYEKCGDDRHCKPGVLGTVECLSAANLVQNCCPVGEEIVGTECKPIADLPTCGNGLLCSFDVLHGYDSSCRGTADQHIYCCKQGETISTDGKSCVAPAGGTTAEVDEECGCFVEYPTGNGTKKKVYGIRRDSCLAKGSAGGNATVALGLGYVDGKNCCRSDWGSDDGVLMSGGKIQWVETTGEQCQ